MLDIDKLQSRNIANPHAKASRAEQQTCCTDHVCIVLCTIVRAAGQVSASMEQAMAAFDEVSAPWQCLQARCAYGCHREQVSNLRCRVMLHAMAESLCCSSLQTFDSACYTLACAATLQVHQLHKLQSCASVPEMGM